MNFSKLTAYLDSLKDVGISGCDLIVYQNHKEIYRHITGLRDRENNIPMDGKEIYWIYSATKVHTCTAALQLVEKGLIGLDDPVGKYLPAFQTLSVIENGHVRAPRTTMTIRHLFAMQGGLNYDVESPSIMKAKFYSGDKADTVAMVNAIAEEPLSFDPGTHYMYSLCHDVLAAVVETVSGMKFSEYLKKNIWDKLGMKDVGFILTDEKKARFAKQYMYDENTKTSHVWEMGDKNRYQLTKNYESGGAGLLSTVEDYILLSDALANGGVGKTGERILTEGAIDLMRENQQTGACMEDWKTFNRIGYGYGLGVRTLMDDTHSKSPVGEFGWDGAACAYTMIDPKNKLSAYYGQQVLGCGYGYHTIHPAIRDLIYEGLEA
ncbi:MAG: beta-lactamase family protein [Clostridia bacterium]|nr:beta-lactamase family protein [Clostridia bacterium]MBQ4156604.1 beta-lactamase family protein [Clostridia bacterium]